MAMQARAHNGTVAISDLVALGTLFPEVESRHLVDVLLTMNRAVNVAINETAESESDVSE